MWTTAHRTTYAQRYWRNVRRIKYPRPQGKNVTLTLYLSISLHSANVAKTVQKNKLHSPHANSDFWRFLKLMIESDTVRPFVHATMAFEAGSARVTAEDTQHAVAEMDYFSFRSASGTPRVRTLSTVVCSRDWRIWELNKMDTLLLTRWFYIFFAGTSQTCCFPNGKINMFSCVDKLNARTYREMFGVKLTFFGPSETFSIATVNGKRCFVH